MISATLKQLDKLLLQARAKHRGVKLYLLSPEQRRRYDAWVADQSADFEAYLDGTLPEQEPVDGDIAKALGLDRPAVTIPAIATEQQASQIYESFLDEY